MSDAKVVPTRVGVNRSKRTIVGACLVVPTRVGVNRPAGARGSTLRRRPHTRGGEPSRNSLTHPGRQSSPHAWG